MAERKDKRHKEDIARYFSGDTNYWRDVYARENDIKISFLSAEMIDRKKAVLRFFDDYAVNRTLRVLDIGCGAGIFMKEVVERGHTAVGLDITEGMLAKAKDMLKNYGTEKAAFLLGDVEKMEFEDGSFDVIICIGVLQYLRDDRKAVGEISRVLKSGGLAIISLPNILRLNNILDPYYYIVRGLQFIIARAGANQDEPAAGFSSNETFLNRRFFYWQLSRLFDDDFSRTGMEGIAYGPPTFWRREILPTAVSLRVSKLMSSLARRRSFSWLNMLANRWVVCLKKKGLRRKL